MKTPAAGRPALSRKATRARVSALKTGAILALRKANSLLKFTDPGRWELARDYIAEGQLLAEMAWDLDLLTLPPAE